MWTKISPHFVRFKSGASTEIYDEVALRKNLISYLSDNSRKRFGGDNFFGDDSFYKGIEWYLAGLKLFYINNEKQSS